MSKHALINLIDANTQYMKEGDYLEMVNILSKMKVEDEDEELLGNIHFYESAIRDDIENHNIYLEKRNKDIENVSGQCKNYERYIENNKAKIENFKERNKTGEVKVLIGINENHARLLKKKEIHIDGIKNDMVSITKLHNERHLRWTEELKKLREKLHKK